MTEFYSQKDVKASHKRRVCKECRHTIGIGQPYRKWVAMRDGYFYSGICHPDCQDWANIVIDYEPGEGRPFLCDADPKKQYGVEKIPANMPSDDLFNRLPPQWKDIVEAIKLFPPSGLEEKG